MRKATFVMKVWVVGTKELPLADNVIYWTIRFQQRQNFQWKHSNQLRRNIPHEPGGALQR